MRCSSPRTVGFADDGKTIVWSQKQRSKQFAPFQLPCGKCLECRLEYGRTWAIRCMHEAQMHKDNCFITLTYSEENLKSPKLIYEDFQKFMKKLRFAHPSMPFSQCGPPLKREIGMFVTGEYGEETKRPHWHAIIFNWSPSDGKPKYKTKLGHQVYESDTLTKTWGLGIAEYGSVTLHSANYCARYAAKKLVHGFDQEHDYHPISKKSSKHAIGKKWLEKFWPDIFNYGRLIVDGQSAPIPRYYIKWIMENKPKEYLRYVTGPKQEQINHAYLRSEEEKIVEKNIRYSRSLKTAATGVLAGEGRSQRDAKKIIQRIKHKQVQANLKLK